MIRRLQITLLMLFIGVWAMASETSVKNADGVEIWYNFDSSTKTASVTYKGEKDYTYDDEYIGNVVIPSKVTYEGEEYSVTSIGYSAFSGCSILTSIKIPEGVTEIWSCAFQGCSSLTSITLPESVTSIGWYAFSSCRSLTSITLPESVTSIVDCAFVDCYRLYEVYNKSNLTITAGSIENGYVAYYAKKVYTDDSVESKLHTVGDYIFYVDEDNIELLAYIGDEIAITLPSDYEGKDYIIANYAFYNCDALTSITIPDGVKSIGDGTFRYCSSLISITLPEGVTEIGDDAFNDCSSLTSITLPESVTSIGWSAFYSCRSLTSITIPEGVTSIGKNAFLGCFKLYEVYNKSNLTITAGSSENGDVAFYAKKVYTDDSVESKLHTVGDYIFYVDEDNIELLAYIGDEIAITLPSDYEGKDYIIANRAFEGCNSLTSITIPDSVTEIGERTFLDCSSLTSITIPEGVTEIEDEAFYRCYSLTSIMLSEGVTSIGDYAFCDCSSLTSITLPEGVTEIGKFAFYKCSGLTSITSMNAAPPTCDYPFEGVDESIPVYVLKQSVEAYKSAEYWRDFTNIVGKFLVVTTTAENGTVTGAGVYEENAEVTLIATPDEGYKFVKWEDGETNATRKIKVTENVTLTAVFEKDNHLSLTLLLIVSLSVLLAILLLLKVRRAKR